MNGRLRLVLKCPFVCSFGFRPGRSAHQALEAIRVEVNRGRCWVVDADIASFFDSIRLEVLRAALAERVSDRRMWKLIMGWLRAGVLAGETLLHPEAGTPQGGGQALCSPTWCCTAWTGRGRPSIGGLGSWCATATTSSSCVRPGSGPKRRLGR